MRRLSRAGSRRTASAQIGSRIPRAIGVLLVFGSVLGLSDCASMRSTVKIPSRDATSPQAALNVAGSGKTLLLTIGREPESVELLPRDSLVFIAVGRDLDGGIRELALTGNVRVTCRDGKTGEEWRRTSGFLRSNVAGSPRRTRGPIGKIERFVLRPGDLAALCRRGVFAGAVGQATTTTINFHGGYAVSPRLEFRLAGAPMATADALQPAGSQSAPGSEKGMGDSGSIPSIAPRGG